VSARVEESAREERIDHVWIDVACGLPRPVVVSVNTRSLQSAREGFDPRVRVAVVREACTGCPSSGAREMDAFDYAGFESSRNAFYEKLERKDAEYLLLGLCEAAECIEAWGAPYRRGGREGIHQIHSRQPSHAFPDGIAGQDGGLRFFLREGDICECRTVLIKFDGQK
jgi:hypothetical protein